MTRTFIGRIAMSLALIFTFASCDKEPEEQISALPTPKVTVNDITTTSFNLSWDIVTDAGSFTYIFNGGEEVTTVDRSVSFTGLEPAVEYTFSLKADAGNNKGWTDSGFVTLKITTDGESQLSSPEPQLVAAYMSKTIISWKSVPGAASYEYSVGQTKGQTTSCSVELAGFDGDTEYEFSVSAISDDPHVVASVPGVLKFKTLPASEDIPPIIIGINETGCDYIDFNVYAVSDFRYLYFAVPAVYFSNHSDRQVMETYRQYVIDAIESNGYTMEAGIDLFSSYGSSNYVESNVYPEMSYYVVAFGIDSVGNILTSLYKTPVKTLANGSADGPQVTGADWFSQSLFYYQFGGYNPTNCLGFTWKGRDVKETRYLMTSTYSFRHYFGASEETLRKYVTKFGTSVTRSDVIDNINAAGGYSYRYSLPSATSYTFATLAVNSASDTTFVVNTLATKASQSFYDWVFLSLGPASDYPKTSLTAKISMSFDSKETLNIQAREIKYLLKPSESLSGVSSSEAEALVESQGISFTAAQVATLNMTGSVTFSFGGAPESSSASGVQSQAPLNPGSDYTLLVNFTAANGDKIFRSRTASTAGGESSDEKTKAAADGTEYKAVIKLNPGTVLDLYNF